MNSLRAWWHQHMLGHQQLPLMNDGTAGPRVYCFCPGRKKPRRFNT